VQLLVIWGGLMVLDVAFEARGRGSWSIFLVLTLTGAVASSLGAVVWSHAHQLDSHQAIRLWNGWVAGAFLLGGLLVVPIHYLAGSQVRAWLEANLELPSQQRLGPRGGAILLLATLLLIVAIAIQVATRFVGSLAGAARPEVALGALLPDLALFAGLIFAAFLGTTMLFAVALTHRNGRERRLARVDGLTGCLNRLAFAELYAREKERCARLELPISVVFLDLDHFKAINDKYDYGFGDLVLKEAAERVGNTVRDTDYLFRWGGEEFVVLLPHTCEDDAAIAAVRIRRTLRAKPISRDGRELRVTASFGVAGAKEPPASARELIDRASLACAGAKRTGRDRVETAAPAVAPSGG
jgi:diguanylate cyclase (GGDEF)-like protein